MAHNAGYFQQPQPPLQQPPQPAQYGQIYTQPQNIYQQLGQPQPQPHLQRHPTYTVPQQQQQQYSVQPQQFQYAQQQFAQPQTNQGRPLTVYSPYQQPPPQQYLHSQTPQAVYSQFPQRPPPQVARVPSGTADPRNALVYASRSPAFAQHSTPGPPIAPSAALAQQVQPQLQPIQTQMNSASVRLPAQPPTPGRRPLPQPSSNNKSQTAPSLQRAATLTASQPPTISAPNIPPTQAQIQISTPGTPTRSRPLPTPNVANKRATIDLGQFSTTSSSAEVAPVQKSLSSSAELNARQPVTGSEPLPQSTGVNHLGLRRTPSPVKSAPLSRTLTQATQGSAVSSITTKRRSSPPRFQGASPTHSWKPNTNPNMTQGDSALQTQKVPVSSNTGNGNNANTTQNNPPFGQASTTSTSESSPPKKFVPIWKRTIPDYPMPVFGYAAGLVKDPHPTIKPVQPPLATAPVATSPPNPQQVYQPQQPQQPQSINGYSEQRQQGSKHTRTPAVHVSSEEDSEEDSEEMSDEETDSDSEDENEEAYGGYERTSHTRSSYTDKDERRRFKREGGARRVNGKEQVSNGLSKERKRYSKGIQGAYERERDREREEKKRRVKERGTGKLKKVGHAGDPAKMRERERRNPTDKSRRHTPSRHSPEFSAESEGFSSERDNREWERGKARRYSLERRSGEYISGRSPNNHSRNHRSYEEHSPERFNSPPRKTREPDPPRSPQYGIRDLPSRTAQYEQYSDIDVYEQEGHYRDKNAYHARSQSGLREYEPPRRDIGQPRAGHSQLQNQSRVGFSQTPMMTSETSGVRRRTEMLRGGEDDSDEVISSRFAKFSVNESKRYAANHSRGGGWPEDLPRLPRTPGTPGGTVRVGVDGYFDLDSPGRIAVSRREQLRPDLDDPPPRSVSPVLSGRPQSQINLPKTKVDDGRLQRRRSMYAADNGEYHEHVLTRPQSEMFPEQMYGRQMQESGVDQHYQQQQQYGNPHQGQVFPTQQHDNTRSSSFQERVNQRQAQSTNDHFSPRQPVRHYDNPTAPSINIESPAPVGGRDKMADIKRMEAMRVEPSGSEVNNIRRVDKGKGIMEGERPGMNNSSVVSPRINIEQPRINVEIPRLQHQDAPLVNTESHRNDTDRSSYRPIINIEPPRVDPNNSPQGPMINVKPAPSVHVEPPSPIQRRGEVPQVQVYDVPEISFSVTSDETSYGGQQPQNQHEASPRQPRRVLPQGPVIHPPGVRQGMICAGCHGPIIGRIVSAMGVRWHPGCFKCTICDGLLEHVSSFERDGRPYCHLDYHENFAPRCYSCKTSIIEERFISLDDPALGKRAYHEQHFFCAECGDPFLSPSAFSGNGELSLNGDGEFEGFTVYKGHPYCEACHVRLRFPKCKRCKRSIREGDEAVEALGGKWCWSCFICAGCEKPFEDPSFFQRGDKPFCERCFSIILRNEV